MKVEEFYKTKKKTWGMQLDTVRGSADVSIASSVAAGFNFYFAITQTLKEK